MPFEHAWRMAQKRVHWPYETEERHQWRSILREHEEVWRQAYEDHPDADLENQFSAIEIVA